MNKLITRSLSSLLLATLMMISFPVDIFAAKPVPAAKAAQPAQEEPSAVEPVISAGPQHFFVGLQPQHKLYVQGYLIDALHFAHNSYGYVAWSMQAARRNLKEALFEEHLKQLDYFITQTVGLAELSIRLTPDSDGLPEIMAQYEVLGQAVKLMLEENKATPDATEPGAKIIESGKLHEQVGKAIPALVEKLQKALQEHASASSQINRGE